MSAVGAELLAAGRAGTVAVLRGFTHSTNEFATRYRVINWHACNGCWNDPRVRFDHKDFFWCPRHAGTPRQFECTRLITSAHVIATMQRVPRLAERVLADTPVRAFVTDGSGELTS
jgi:autotransporter strand-loop-strand O-heptosyltransferase